MSKQDRQRVRTSADLERKYDLAAIPGLKKAVRNNEEGINKTNQTLEDFVKVTLGSLEELQSQVDGSITTHFYSGEPTLDNVPASEWVTEEEKARHTGDLYYDQNTGYAYRFVINDGVYSWIKLPDNDVAQALAMANAAQDTADNKRRVFLDTPYTPFDNGDLWIYNQEIYVCQITKSTDESYAEGDFIIATKYTDNTLAEELGDELRVLRGTVTTIKESADSFKVEIESKVTSIDELQQETIEKLDKVSYEFGTEDFKVAKEGEEIETHVSYKGMRVLNNKKEVLVADNEGVKAEDLHATTYLIVGKNSRFEDYGNDRTGCFWIGS